MSRAQQISISGRVPHVIPELLRALHGVSSGRAEHIACVNHWVLIGIRTNEIKDSEMVTWLLDDIIDAFDEVAPPNTSFGVRDDNWGYYADNH